MLLRNKPARMNEEATSEGVGRKHTFAATNPCHVYDMALALYQHGRLGSYISGYPAWRLHPPAGFPFKSRSWRTLVTYALQRFPEALRPDDSRLFRWQDGGFDQAAAGVLHNPAGTVLHGLPGQCLELFRRAKQLGLVTALNHASGPLEQQRKLVAPEYARAGLDLESIAPMPTSYIRRLQQEAALADFHCAASTVVRDQLVADGIPAERIWVVPYGADEGLFPKRRDVPDGPYKICFAGRQSLRKGIHYLLRALESIDSSGWELHCFGMPLRETAADFTGYRGGAELHQRGSVPQAELAREFQRMDLLVLPSAEEAFGLVVVQALACGVPCVVCDRVGAKDLIREGETGSIVPFGDVEALAAAVSAWSKRRMTVMDRFLWSDCARKLVTVADAACGKI